MKRVRRGVYLLLVWLVLLGPAALWGFSYLRHDSWLWLRGERHSLLAITSDGTLKVELGPPEVTRGQPPAFLHFNDEIDRLFDIDAYQGTPDYHAITLPWAPQSPPWYVSTPGGHQLRARWWLLSVPGLIWTVVIIVVQIRNWRHPREGLCPKCGYDLRASPDRCPECGTPVASLASE